MGWEALCMGCQSCDGGIDGRWRNYTSPFYEAVERYSHRFWMASVLHDDSTTYSGIVGVCKRISIGDMPRLLSLFGNTSTRFWGTLSFCMLYIPNSICMYPLSIPIASMLGIMLCWAFGYWWVIILTSYILQEISKAPLRDVMFLYL